MPPFSDDARERSDAEDLAARRAAPSPRAGQPRRRRTCPHCATTMLTREAAPALRRHHHALAWRDRQRLPDVREP